MNEQIINSFSLVGNIAGVNEIKEQNNGTKFRYFTICQNSKYKDQNGEEKDDKHFYSIKIYEKHFKNFEGNLEVGKYVHIMGKVNVYKDVNNKTIISLVGSSCRSLNKDKLDEEIFDYDWINDNSSMEV